MNTGCRNDSVQPATAKRNKTESFEPRCRFQRSKIGSSGKVPGVTGVILAGGASSRMGSDKSLLLYRNGRIIDGVYRAMTELFQEVILVTNTPRLYPFLPCRKVADIYADKGMLAGIHAGLTASTHDAVFVAACDMPQLQGELIRHLTTLSEGVDLVIPSTPGGFEPLHALYGKGCLPSLERLLQIEHQGIFSLLPQVRVREVPTEEVALFDREFASFVNINTPDDYYRLRSCENKPTEPTEDRITHSS